jgi:IclR family transcriptional regulator, pca regulon regulatory protein
MQPGVRDTTGDSASLTTLDGDDVIHVCYVPARRLYRFTVTNGTRELAYASAPGRAILAHIEAGSIDEFMSRTRLEARTERTVTSTTRFREILNEVRHRGYAVVIDEHQPERGARRAGRPGDAAGSFVPARRRRPRSPAR